MQFNLLTLEIYLPSKNSIFNGYRGLLILPIGGKKQYKIEIIIFRKT